MGDDNQVVPTMKPGNVNTPLIFNKELKELIKKAKILVVGAGGIGCELLKNLVMTGFEDIEIIDLDTIDVSNLNRQFLFHKKHVGLSKAMVAKDSVLQFNPNAKIVAHHASVTNSSFGVNYVTKFNMVLNALDNQAARNHVNRLCLAANVPLVESGTSGYTGQVELILKNVTSCYECTPITAQKTYPGCTIRNTPSELIHCIVWAKHLFNQLFGEHDPKNEDEDVSPDHKDSEAQLDGSGDKKTVSTRTWAKGIAYEGSALFKKFFFDDIQVLLSMKKLWESRRKPVPLLLEEANTLTKPSEEREDSALKMKDQILWTISQCANIFNECVTGLKKLLEESEHGYLVWDKDDKFAMEFVAASANIRAHIFGITQKPLFEIKSMAGNIVPAIATSNAVIAGFIVLNALNLLKGQINMCRSVYLREYSNSRGILITRETTFVERNPNCTSCSEKPMATIGTDLSKMKLKDFDSLVLKETFHMIEPEVILVRTGNMILSSEEGEADDLKERTLLDLGVTNGSLLEADDFVQNYKILIVVNQREMLRDDPPFLVLDKAGTLKPKDDSTQKNGSHETPKAGPSQQEVEEEQEEEDDCMMIFDGVPYSGRKRKMDDNPVPAKKRKTGDKKSDDDTVVL